MILFKFLKSKAFLINLILAGFFLALIYYALLISLSKYTHHGEEIEVPNLLGLTYADALELATNQNLKVELSDTVYASENERGLIAAQLPPASSKVKNGRTVYLTINSLHAEQVSMPNFVGASLRQAMADAEIYGVKIGDLKYVPDIAKNNVLEQMVDGEVIPVGTKIDKGTYIDLTLGLGTSNANILAPVLIGHTSAEVDTILQEMYLNVGARFFDNTVKTNTDSATAVVYKQSPKPFYKDLRSGDFIDFWLTVDTNKVFIQPEWVQDSNDNSETDIQYDL